ncbi:hypothetical protein KIPB_007448 [Kipferlia bialata]|uniref:Uncharacterized protein n=1 Tax=Kipferlia bialata TaxID=797122 RepID=A0A9K3D025_9EUKA|nr:hypothetical protein KIPB_006474 [Kipferlia bialata]GIQ85396.1 hypothetical protein KIPB_007049 [Kipferlia bialata]GIQ85730.1 hypothetical protein KIPB_007448 [Kipferlia bialata]|eukprot:g6474.t1
MSTHPTTVPNLFTADSFELKVAGLKPSRSSGRLSHRLSARGSSSVSRLLDEESDFTEREAAYVSDEELSHMVERLRPHSGRGGSRDPSVSPRPVGSLSEAETSQPGSAPHAPSPLKSVHQDACTCEKCAACVDRARETLRDECDTFPEDEVEPSPMCNKGDDFFHL